MPWDPVDTSTAPEEATYAAPEQNVSWLRDLFTGENRTEHPDAPEFLKAYMESQRNAQGNVPLEGPSAVMRSAISPDPKAQLDILRANIPNLETRPDKFGNIMVRAPGMKDFAYLNKPGFSSRDIDELGTQTLATLPLLGFAGKGASLLPKVASSAAALGGSSVAQDLMATAQGSQQGVDVPSALVQGGIGAAGAGIVEPLLGGLYQAGKKALAYPASRLRAAVNPAAEAERRVLGSGAEDAAAGGLNLDAQGVANARAAGQDPRVVDVGGETIRAEARRAANLSPNARKDLENFVTGRFETQTQRLGDFIGQLVRSPWGGRGPNAFLTREELQQAARASRGPLYDAAYQDGAKGIMTPTLEQLATAPTMQNAMKSAHQEILNRMATGRSTGFRGATGAPTLEFWDLTKRRLGDTENALLRSGNKSEAADVGSLRTQLVNELDAAVPSYAPARGTAATFFGADDALDAGEKFVNGRFDLQSARQALTKMTPQERDLFAEGFASRYIDSLNKISDKRNILNAINASPDARSRLNIALGPNRARSVESFLRVEQFMDLVRGAMGNSTTARQLVELGLGGYGLYQQDPNAMALSLLSMGSRWAGRTMDRRVSEQVVKLLLSSDTDAFLKGIKQVSSGPVLQTLRALDKGLEKAGIGRAVGSKALGNQFSPTNQVQPTTTPTESLPQGSGTPGGPPPSGPTPPAGRGSPGSASLDAASAYHAAMNAIESGADKEAVKQRLAENGFDPAAIA